MTAYYNEIDPGAAAWLRELIKRELIAAGDVDERSITDVEPSDLAGYTQCHFFAGIGGWSYALRLAGWPDDRPVWTGSCPCQPFSAAGKQRGSDDERHLWPTFWRLIRERRPASVFGEQVSGAAGLAWLDHVCADLENDGYAVAAADLCAAGIGAPHIRQRLYWMAHAEYSERRPVHGRHGRHGTDGGWQEAHGEPGTCGEVRGLAHANNTGSQGRQFGRDGAAGSEAGPGGVGCEGGGPLHGFWSDADWLGCRDGRWRPVEPGSFPLAHGLPARVGRLRGYGNAIVPQVAAEFVSAFLDVKEAA